MMTVYINASGTGIHEEDECGVVQSAASRLIKMATTELMNANVAAALFAQARGYTSDHRTADVVIAPIVRRAIAFGDVPR